MTVALLDANLLIALFWSKHEHHAAAHRWFASREPARWATCPLTQLAFVRILSNPALSADAPSPADALALLTVNLAHPRHTFWPDDLPLPAALGAAGAHIQGPRQLTDAYVLALAAKRKGVLATFDTPIASLAKLGGWAAALEIVSTR